MMQLLHYDFVNFKEIFEKFLIELFSNKLSTSSYRIYIYAISHREILDELFFPTNNNVELIKCLNSLNIENYYKKEGNKIYKLSISGETYLISTLINSNTVIGNKKLKYLAILRLDESLLLNVIIEMEIYNFLYWASSYNNINAITHVEYQVGKLIQDVGKRYLNNISSYPYDTYSLIDKISSLRYEGESAKGRIIITSNQEILDNSLDISFISKPNLGEQKKIRKLVEISSERYPIICNGFVIFGFAEIYKIEQLVDKIIYDGGNLNDCKFHVIDFSTEFNWKCSHYNPYTGKIETIMRITNSSPKISLSDDASNIKLVFNQIFNDITNFKRQIKIIKYAIRQKHGTIVVFLEDPKKEVDRLKTGFKIKVANADEKIERISSIDGALIFDKYGDLYSFGVIIDGESKDYAEEDVERGARYNSSIKYSASVKQKCLIVVVSEDGYVDYISGGKKIM